MTVIETEQHLELTPSTRKEEGDFRGKLGIERPATLITEVYEQPREVRQITMLIFLSLLLDLRQSSRLLTTLYTHETFRPIFHRPNEIAGRFQNKPSDFSRSYWLERFLSGPFRRSVGEFINRCDGNDDALSSSTS